MKHGLESGIEIHEWMSVAIDCYNKHFPKKEEGVRFFDHNEMIVVSGSKKSISQDFINVFKFIKQYNIDLSGFKEFVNLINEDDQEGYFYEILKNIKNKKDLNSYFNDPLILIVYYLADSDEYATNFYLNFPLSAATKNLVFSDVGIMEWEEYSVPISSIVELNKNHPENILRFDFYKLCIDYYTKFISDDVIKYKNAFHISDDWIEIFNFIEKKDIKLNKFQEYLEFESDTKGAMFDSIIKKKELHIEFNYPIILILYFLVDNYPEEFYHEFPLTPATKSSVYSDLGISTIDLD